MATVDIHYIKAVLNCARRKGITTDTMLDQVGISPEQLNLPNVRFHGDQMTRLVQLVWSDLADEFMGCTERPCKRGVFAFMSRQSLHYESLNSILRYGIDFYNLVTDDIRMKLVLQGNTVTLEIEFSRAELDPDHFFQEFWMVIWHRFCSWIIGRKIPLIQVCFTYPKPAHQNELKYLFPCRHHFNRTLLKLSFSAEFLALPPVRTQRDLSRFLQHSPADLITIPGKEVSYRARIRSLLLNQETEVLLCPAFEFLAKKFNISSQTLRRKLKYEGTSYPVIKDEIRLDLAIDKLLSEKLPISEIARLLGFSEPRSFTRAFKHWTGQTPTQYRRQQR